MGLRIARSEEGVRRNPSFYRVQVTFHWRFERGACEGSVKSSELLCPKFVHSYVSRLSAFCSSKLVVSGKLEKGRKKTRN